VLQVEAEGLPAFDLNQAVDAEEGTRVLAFSNLFGVAMGDEEPSVQKGVVAVRTSLEARRGTFETPYNGPVYVIDAVTNNPGAAGGALTDYQGRLVGMLGKELRNSRNNTWLNYAVPVDQFRKSVEEIRAGKFVVRKEEGRKKPARPLTPALLGIVLVPDVVERTPPYVDGVRPDSPAAAAGIRPDDLVVLVGDHLVQSCKALSAELEYLDATGPVKLTLLRGRELIETQLKAGAEEGKK
jgi:serine protease Do